VAPDLRWDAPLRLLGAVRYLTLGGRAQGAFATWEDFRRALSDERDQIRRFMAERSVQTNEVRRSWFLLPAFLYLADAAGAHTFDLIELGSSAGFNLIWDRYRYRYQGGSWGPEQAPLDLTGEERWPVPAGLLGQRPVVRDRLGLDLEPVDVTNDDAVRLLKAFVWMGQDDRLAAIDRAVQAVRTDPPEIRRGDYVELLPEILGSRPPGALTVVFETASTGYLTADRRRLLHRALDEAAEVEPLGWVSTSPPNDPELHAFGIQAAILPGESRLLMNADFHGAWLEWL
jgi:hypothetical protein